MADHPATCAGCGCVCDDIEVAGSGDALQEVRNTCRLGDAWFAERASPAPAPARVDGRDVDVAEAVGAAAGILAGARLPLVCGLARSDNESARAAVALAEAVGAVIDPVGPPGDGAAGGAAQVAGLSTASFADIRDRAEIVVAWRADPVTTNPRLLPRLRLERGDRGGGELHPPRTLVVVDAERTATAEEADELIELAPELDFEALWAMRALARDVRLERDLVARLPLDALGGLVERLKACSYGAILHGAGLGDEVHALALHALVRDLDSVAHVVSLPLRHDGNARGADDVLAWQTGFPSAVSLATGHARAQRGEFSAAAMLGRGDPDAALVIGAGTLGYLPPDAAEHLRRIPAIVVGPRATEDAADARVAVATAAGGVHREGIVHRMDGVPLPLRAPLTSPLLGVADVLSAMTARIAREAER